MGVFDQVPAPFDDDDDAGLLALGDTGEVAWRCFGEVEPPTGGVFGEDGSAVGETGSSVDFLGEVETGSGLFGGGGGGGGGGGESSERGGELGSFSFILGCLGRTERGDEVR
jgi:hypothetical protein